MAAQKLSLDTRFPESGRAVCFLEKGYCHQRTFQTSVLRKLSPASTCWETPWACSLGGAWAWETWGADPTDGSSSPLHAAPIRTLLLWTISSLKFIWNKRILFLNILEITLIDCLKFETLPEVLNQGPWICGFGWEKLYLYIHWSTGWGKSRFTLGVHKTQFIII